MFGHRIYIQQSKQMNYYSGTSYMYVEIYKMKHKLPNKLSNKLMPYQKTKQLIYMYIEHVNNLRKTQQKCFLHNKEGSNCGRDIMFSR